MMGEIKQKKFLLLFFLLCKILFAETLEIEGKESYQVKEYMTYTLADDINETVEVLGNKKWTKTKEGFTHIQFSDKAYWAKLELKNNSLNPQTYYLKSENQFTYHIEFFLVKKNGLVTYIEDGVIAKNQNREFNTNHMLFPVNLEAEEEVSIFFKIQNYNKIDINFYLHSREYLLNFYQTYNLIEGVFFGAMLMMMFYNLFLYFLLKFRAYLYYVLYTLWLIIYFVGLFGFSQRYFADYTWIFYISSGAFFIALTLFVQSILNLKEQLVMVYKILNFFIGYFIIATIINIVVLEMRMFLYAEILFNLFFILVTGFFIIIIFATYYLAYFRKDIIARFYSFIWTGVAFVGFLLPLVYLNLISIDIPSDYIFQFLILFEVLCFSFILAYKIRFIEKEKKEQEQLLVQQNKLASMGEMVSAIAHQWRQPLSEINGIVLNMDLDYKKKRLSTASLDKHLNDLNLTTSYMSHTIQDFMDFFKQNKHPENFEISEVIDASLNLLTITKENNIDIIYEAGQKVNIMTYKSELIQALLIVLTNSIDACLNNHIKKAKIRITYQLENKLLAIKILDNGGGIPDNILDKIYTPYFTTKHESKGTGLGLYILKMIIEQNMQGRIEIESNSQNTCFIIKIPLELGKNNHFS